MTCRSNVSPIIRNQENNIASANKEIIETHVAVNQYYNYSEMIKYAHNKYAGRTRKIPSEDTLFYFRKRRRTAVSVTANVGACWVYAHTL